MMSGFLLLVCRTYRAIAVRNILMLRQRFQHCVNVLQHRRLALLAPIQSNHLLVRLNLVDVGWQLFEMIEQRPILANLLPLIHPLTRRLLPVTPARRLIATARSMVLRAGARRLLT